MVHTLGAGLIALSTLELISGVSGTGWGWLRTATAADQSFTAVTPVNALAKALSGAANLVDVNLSALGARTVISLIGLACAAAIGTWLLLRSPGPAMQRNLGLTLLVVALLGPILWNWYITWGVIVLAPVVTGTLRRLVIILSTFELLVGLSSVKNLVHDRGGGRPPLRPDSGGGDLRSRDRPVGPVPTIPDTVAGTPVGDRRSDDRAPGLRKCHARAGASVGCVSRVCRRWLDTPPANR